MLGEKSGGARPHADVNSSSAFTFHRVAALLRGHGSSSLFLGYVAPNHVRRIPYYAYLSPIGFWATVARVGDGPATAAAAV